MWKLRDSALLITGVVVYISISYVLPPRCVWVDHLLCTWLLGRYLRTILLLASLMVRFDSECKVYSDTIWSETHIARMHSLAKLNELNK